MPTVIYADTNIIHQQANLVNTNVKKCSRCHEEKPLLEFAKDASRKDGHSYHCKICHNGIRGQSYRNRVDTLISYTPRDPSAKKFDRKVHNMQYRKANLGRNAAYSAKRKAQKIKATPQWYEHGAVVQLYKEAQLLMEQFGTEYHVDHIVPLQSDKVCGLHCLDNLQLLTKIILSSFKNVNNYFILLQLNNF